MATLIRWQLSLEAKQIQAVIEIVLMFFVYFFSSITSSIAAEMLLLACIIQSDINRFQRNISALLSSTLSFLFSAEGLLSPSSCCESNYTNNMHTVLRYLQKLLPKAQIASSAPLLFYPSSLLYREAYLFHLQYCIKHREAYLAVSSLRSIIWTHLTSA